MVDCVDEVFLRYNWWDMQATLKSPDYFWGLTHGDVHHNRFMYKTDGSGELVLQGWLSSGIMGNPSLDLVTWIWYEHTKDDPMSFEEKMI